MGEATQLPWDKIIGAAAASTLGVLSLCVILIGVLAYLFFGRSDDRVKLWVFGAILLAVIGLAIAVLRESQDGRDHATMPPGSLPSDAPSASTTASDDPPHATPQPLDGAGALPSATPTPAPASPPVGADGTPDLNGLWSDEAFTYQVSVQGSHMSYVQLQNGMRVGAGDGSITGRRLVYRFIVDATGEGGVCRGLAAPDGDTVDGTCVAGGGSYRFSIVRNDR